MADLPDKVTHLGLTWDIVYDTATLDRDGNWGQTRGRRSEIALTDDVPHARIAATLLHELLHVVSDSVTNANAPTEDHITALASGLFGLLADNPDVRHFIWPEED